MKKGYDVILNLRYRTTIKIETEEEDEEKIKEGVRQEWIQDVLDVCGARDLLENVKAVKIGLVRQENTKTFLVWLNCRGVSIGHYVNAETEEEAVDHLEDDLTLQFTSEDGNTDCEVSHYDIDCVEEPDFEKED